MEPLSDIINTTPAKSLLYECVNTLLSGRLTSKTVIRLCLDKLRTFIEDPDQNCQYRWIETCWWGCHAPCMTFYDI